MLTANRVILLKVDLNIEAVPDALAVNLDKFPVLKKNILDVRIASFLNDHK